MEKSTKSIVLESVTTRLAKIETVAPYMPSASALALLASDPLAGIEALKIEGNAWKNIHSADPLESCALQAVLGAVILFKTEEEAFGVLNKAKAFWRSAKGLKGLFLSTLNEAELGEFNGDFNRSELIKLCQAWQARGTQGTAVFVDVHGLQKTAGNVLSVNGAQVARIAKWEAEEAKETPAPAPAPAKPAPLLTSAQIANAKRKAEKAGK